VTGSDTVTSSVLEHRSAISLSDYDPERCHIRELSPVLRISVCESCRGETSVLALPEGRTFSYPKMRTKSKAAGVAAKTKATESKFTARVSVSTAERIAYLAEQYNQPRALIAGAIAGLGNELVNDGKAAEAAGKTWNRVLMELIRRDHPKARVSIPVLIDEFDSDSAELWIKDLNRTREEWLGQLIELGIQHYQKPQLLIHSLPIEQAFFLTMSARILGDNNSEDPEVIALLKPPAKAPPGLIAFEKILEGEGGKVA